MTAFALTTLLLLNPLQFAQTTTNATNAPNSSTASTFYLSATGNDSNSGRTTDQAWRTLARLQTQISTSGLQAGDQVLFARGATFAGKLALTSQQQGIAATPILFGNYGTGDAPVLSGLSTLANWQALGNNRWRAACASCSGIPAFLLMDGEPQRLARWPNLDEGEKGYEGYRYYSAFSGRTSITDPSLPTDKNWVGGEVVLRAIAWVLDRLPITAQSGGTLNFGTPASYAIQAGYGYFIQNHLNALDRDGEWVYDAANKTITLQSGSNPNTQRIELPAETNLLEIRGSGYLVFRGLDLHGATQDIVNADACNHIVFDQVNLRYNGGTALATGNCNTITLSNARVQDSMDVGLDMQPCANCNISAVMLERIGLLAGMGGNGDGHYFGAVLGGASFVMENSVVREIGYVAVSVYGPGTVRNNLISGYNRVKNDGAGLYTWGQSDVAFINNIVRDAQGSKAGTPWGGTATNGIYVDDNSERVTVQGNTVANVSGAGIYLHNTRDVTVTDNVVFNTGEVGLQMTDDNLGTYGLERSLIRRNQFVVRDVPMIAVQSDITVNLFDALGVIDGNVFCDPFADPSFTANLPGLGERTVSLAQWRAGYGRDLTSTQCADRYPARIVVGTPGPNLVSNGAFNSDLNNWFGWPDDTLDARWENGRLDGGSVRIGFKGPAAYLHYDTPVGALQNGQTYRLRADAVSIAQVPALTAYLRQSGAPYDRVSQTAPLFVDGSRRSFEIFFDTAKAEADALLIFEMSAQGSTVGLDNVQLQAVNAAPRPMTDVVRFEANASSQAQPVVLDNYIYRGVEGTVYAAGSTLMVEPYKSILLLRGAASVPTVTSTPTSTPISTPAPTSSPTPNVITGKNDSWVYLPVLLR